ncbi:MAG: hypothetical protein WA991_03065 [Ornithinimicrobium sp.]
MAGHILAEVDRQLGEQRARADALATRSGLLIAAATVLAGTVSGSALTTSQLGLTPWTLGASATLGVAVLLMGRLLMGPSPSQLGSLRDRASDEVAEQLLLSKLIAVEANVRVLDRTEVFLVLQAIGTVASSALLIYILAR